MYIKPHIQEANTPWNGTKKNWLIVLVTKFVFFCTFFSLAAIVLRWNKLPPVVPLWYSRPWGADQLATPYWLFILPLGSMIIYAMNRALCMYVTSEYLIFAQVLYLTSLLITLLSFITLIKIIFLMT